MAGNPNAAAPRNRRLSSAQGGFLLLETLLAILFLTVGLTTVLRSYGSSLNSLAISADYTKALVLLEQSLWLYEAKGSIAPGIYSGRFPDENNDFHWEIEASEITDLNICSTRATVTWERRGKVREVTVVTYLTRE